MPRTNDAGLVEKHVEKIVLAATVVAMVVVMAVWVFSSPRSLPLKSPGAGMAAGTYPPAEVDRALHDMAETLKNKLERVQPKHVPVVDYAGLHAAKFARPYPVGKMPGLIAFGRGGEKLVPTTRPALAQVELAALLPLVAPEMPLAKAARELVSVPVITPAPERPAAAQPAVEQTTYKAKELVAAHVAAVFEHGKVLEKWRKALTGTRARSRLVVLAVEARRRHLLPDGQWSKPVPVSMVREPAEAPFDPLPTFDPKTKNHDEVLAGAEVMADVRSQQWVLEPEYYSVFRDRREIDWALNKPRTRVSEMEGVVLGEPRATGVGPTVPRTVRPSPGRPVGPRGPVSGDEYMRQKSLIGYEDMYRQFGPGGYPTGPGTGNAPSRTRSPSPTRREVDITRPPTPSRVRRDVSRSRAPVYRPSPSRTPVEPPRTVTPRPTRQPTRTVTSPLAVPLEPQEPSSRVPPLAEQLSHEDGILEVWFHDTALTEMVTYSYQIRLVLLNPLFGQVKDVKKAGDADQLQLMTPWSKWSEPVKVKRPTEFLLAGAMPGDSVYVKVITQKWGQSVEHPFTIRPGDPIGAEAEKPLVPPDAEEEKNVKVDFSTGAVAVAVGERRVRVPNSGFVKSTPELLYLDADGNLRSRTLLEDERKLRRLRTAAAAVVVPRP